MVTPVPIPNTEVKHFIGEYSYACHSETSKLPGYLPVFIHWFFLYFVVIYFSEVYFMQIKVNSLDETFALAAKIVPLLPEPALICLSGDLGAGKTAFTKGVGKALNIKRTINSPTFNILKSYNGDRILNHIDAYRLEGTNQDLGFEEIFDENITIVEWPQFIQDFLPETYLSIEIKRLDGDLRIFDISAVGEDYKRIVEELI